MNPLPRSTFDSRQLPLKHRYDAWRDSISVVFDYQLQASVPEEQFFASIDNVLFDDAFILSAFHAQAASYERNAARIAADSLDMIMLQFALEGPCQLLASRAQRQCRVGDIVIMDATQPIHNRNARERNITLSVSRQALKNLVKDIESSHLAVIAANEPAAVMLRSHLLALYGNLPQVAAASSPGVIDSTLALAAAALNAALGQATGDSPPLRQSLRARANLLIEQWLHQPAIPIERLAAAVPCSRTRLYALFADDGGVGRYIQRRRLQTAAARLMSARHRHLSITGIACASGFTNMSSFSRAFKLEFGITPRELRRQCANAPAASSNQHMTQGQTSRHYETWVRELLRTH